MAKRKNTKRQTMIYNKKQNKTKEYTVNWRLSNKNPIKSGDNLGAIEG